MRFFAKRQGLSLSDKGIKLDQMKGVDYLIKIGTIPALPRGNYKINGDVIDCNCVTEQDVFKALGLPELYKEPHERTGSVFPKKHTNFRV